MTLEEAIEIGADECHCPVEVMNDALRLMMPAIRAAIIEECARVAENCYDKTPSVMGTIVVAAIRALKSPIDTPPEER